MKKNTLNSPRLLKIKKEKHKVVRRKIFFIIFLFIAFFIILIFVFKWQKININNIQISGNKIIESKNIEEVIRNDISGNYLWFFPKSNFLFYPKEKIKEDLAQKFERLNNINLSVNDFNTLNILVSERNALYTWCGVIPLNASDSVGNVINNPNMNTNQEQCYFMDENGFIFDKAPYFSGEIYLKFYGIPNTQYSTSLNNPLGLYFYKTNFQKLILFKESFEKIGIKPVAFYEKDNGDIEMFLTSVSSLVMGPEILFKIDSDEKQLVENLQTVLTTDPLQTEFKNKYASLLYIDLRYGNKVYYKFK